MQTPEPQRSEARGQQPLVFDRRLPTRDLQDVRV